MAFIEAVEDAALEACFNSRARSSKTARVIDDRSVVLSADTRYNENVVKYATGADLLVHEIAAGRPEAASEPHIQRIMGHHTTPREAGLVFARKLPKLAAFTHIVLLPGTHVPPPTLDDIVSETQETYSGPPLEVGEDLMAFDIRETVIVRLHHASV